jgi:hypothetical protein
MLVASSCAAVIVSETSSSGWLMAYSARCFCGSRLDLEDAMHIIPAHL